MASNPSTPLPAPQLSAVPSPAAPPAPESARLSEGQRLAYTFFAPSKAFTDLRRNASWWGPFLVIVVTSLLFVTVVDRTVGFRKVADNLIQMQPKQAERIGNMPADQRQQVMAREATVTKVISYGVPLIGLVLYAVFSAVLLATVKFGAGAEVNYKTMFALVVYTRLPQVVMSLLGMLSLVAGVSGDGFNIQNPVASNFGYFLGPESSPVLRALLTPLDIFTIWTLVLTAIGISCISKVKRGTAYAIVFGWFAIIVMARVGLAAVGS